MTEIDARRAPSIGDDDKVVTLPPSDDQLPLDEAFADGGWRLMARDRVFCPDQFDDDPYSRASAALIWDRLIKEAA